MLMELRSWRDALRLERFHLYSVRSHGTPAFQEVPMAAPYSMDLRERVIQDAEAGLSTKELTAR
jgi:hypothetical protein